MFVLALLGCAPAPVHTPALTRSCHVSFLETEARCASEGRVVVLPALLSMPRVPPLFALLDGPGVQSTQRAPHHAPWLLEMQRRRDVVLVDPPEDARSTLDLVEDLEEVRQWLDADRVDVVATGAASRVALAWLTSDTVSHVVLDSPEDPTVPAEWVGSHVLDRMHAHCLATSGAERCGPLSQQVRELLDTLPETYDTPAGPRPLSRGLVLERIEDRLGSAPWARTLPAAIDAARRGRWTPLLMAEPPLPETPTLHGIRCTEDVPRYPVSPDPGTRAEARAARCSPAEATLPTLSTTDPRTFALVGAHDPSPATVSPNTVVVPHHSGDLLFDASARDLAMDFLDGRPATPAWPELAAVPMARWPEP